MSRAPHPQGWTSVRALLQAPRMSFWCTSSQVHRGPKSQHRLCIPRGPGCKAHAHGLARGKGSTGRLPSLPFRLVHSGSPCLWPGWPLHHQSICLPSPVLPPPSFFPASRPWASLLSSRRAVHSVSIILCLPFSPLFFPCSSVSRSPALCSSVSLSLPSAHFPLA